jgi:hypothetical protein
MHSFSDVIAKWPGLTEFKRDMGVPITTAQSWRDRDSIPNGYWKTLIEKGRARGIRGITYALLGQFEPGACAKSRDGQSPKEHRVA